MKISIKRFNPQNHDLNTFNTFETEEKNLLKSLIFIKENVDNSLTFRCVCKSGVCGSCSVRVNGVEKLACKTIIQDGDIIEPLRNREIVKDLVVNVSHETFLIKQTKSYLNKNSDKKIYQEDIKRIDLQSNCILCNSCYSSCPVYEINKEFIGPFALTRALRYINDIKNNETNEILSSVQNNGIWNCTLCSACTLVCSQNIDPKADILQLQNISVQNGYENPNLENFDLSFNDDFGGFNPNGF